jgi:hypothetical protein
MGIDLCESEINDVGMGSYIQCTPVVSCFYDFVNVKVGHKQCSKIAEAQIYMLDTVLIPERKYCIDLTNGSLTIE